MNWPKKTEWGDARIKVNSEYRCRNCGVGGNLEAAHTIGRAKQDVICEAPRGGRYRLVKAEAIIPMCRDCHRAYDERKLDILSLLNVSEQLCAVEAAGGIYSALQRLCPTEYGRSA